MKFSIGDKIILRTSGEEGEVTGYINQDMLEVMVHGVTFPVYADDIDHPYLKWFSEKKKEKKQSSPSSFIPEPEQIRNRPARLARGIYLSFLPVYEPDIFEDVVQQLKIFLINELPQPIRFFYNAVKSGTSLFKHEGSLHAFGHLYIHSVDIGDIGQMRFEWKAGPDKTPKEQSLQGKLQIKAARLFELLADMQQNNEPSFHYLLADDLSISLPDGPLQSAPPIYTAKKEPQGIIQSVAQLELPRYEVDLHIEQIAGSRKGLTNAAIIQLQLETLQHYLQLAIAHKQDRMIIIHGLGKGKLKEEVHRALREIPEVKRFVNEWHGRYGFGATEVIFGY